jgi:hypothetical protein
VFLGQIKTLLTQILERGVKLSICKSLEPTMLGRLADAITDGALLRSINNVTLGHVVEVFVDRALCMWLF